MTNWSECKNILCIRADNLGDVLMSSPAMRALKQTFGCRITLLTSSMATGISSFIEEVDEIILFNFPWVKNSTHAAPSISFFEIVESIKSYQFDAAVIFTVCSQNPLPAAMLAYLANIPRRLAYCRENPYHLLSEWVPDPEPYNFIRHQVKRDLDLVKTVGATTKEDQMELTIPSAFWWSTKEKLRRIGVDPSKAYFILHAGVSEKKREYPEELWVETAKKITETFKIPLLLTGTHSEKPLIDRLIEKIGKNAFALAGLLDLGEFCALIQHSQTVLSVNTGTIHIAAAVRAPIVVLYALTNPQHLPYKAKGKALFFTVDPTLKSKNEVIRYMNEHEMPHNLPMLTPEEVLNALQELFESHFSDEMPEMPPLGDIVFQ